jgi:hypothetical protein
MTTEQLRKEITVTHWSINNSGISIKYFKKTDTQNDYYELEINPEECAHQLSAIGSIDSWEADTFLLNYENSQLHWAAFVHTFKLSQWEALTLVIRHELEKETEKEINQGDIGKAIDSITK